MIRSASRAPATYFGKYSPRSIFAEKVGCPQVASPSYENLIDEVLATYAHDNRGQLTSAVDSNTVLPDEDYDYDDNGNRELVDYVFGADQDYEIDPNNRLAFDGTHAYHFDDEGNRTAKFEDGDEDGVWDVGEAGEAYTWDHRNRLVQVDFKPDGDEVDASIAYRYDAYNQLLARLYLNDGGLEELLGGGEEQMLGGVELLFDDPGLQDDPLTVFVYDRGQVVYQFDILAMGGFESVTAADLSHRYLWGPQVDQLLTDEQVVSLGSEGEVLWAIADNIGSVRDVIDSNADLRIHRQFDTFGNIVDELHYDTSGDPVSSTDPEFVTVAFAFTGRWRDPNTGLQNNLNRWYDSIVGSWISEDPLGLGPDANPNRYVHNMPTMYVDPLGLSGGDGNHQGRRCEVRPDPHASISGAFWGSLTNSWHSMQGTYTSLILEHWYGMEDEAQDVMEEAYQEGPLGQTQDSDGLDYYGPRAALGVSTGATVGATVILTWQAIAAASSFFFGEPSGREIAEQRIGELVDEIHQLEGEMESLTDADEILDTWELIQNVDKLIRYWAELL